MRLGFATEKKSYDQTYRAACAAVREEIGGDAARITALRERFRTHGQTLCGRTGPRCAVCPVASLCPHPST